MKHNNCINIDCAAPHIINDCPPDRETWWTLRNPTLQWRRQSSTDVHSLSSWISDVRVTWPPFHCQMTEVMRSMNEFQWKSGSVIIPINILCSESDCHFITATWSIPFLSLCMSQTYGHSFVRLVPCNITSDIAISSTKVNVTHYLWRKIPLWVKHRARSPRHNPGQHGIAISSLDLSF